jgi:hypothetical protein
MIDFLKIKSKDLRELEKSCNALIKDMLDNFDDYSDEDKQATLNAVNNLKEFNKNVLDKYDKKNKVKKNVSWFEEIFLRITGE